MRHPLGSQRRSARPPIRSARSSLRTPRLRAKPDQARAVLAALPLAQLLFALGRGIPPDELCRSAGLEPRELSDRDRFVPYSWYLALWQALSQCCPGVPVGIEFGKFFSLDHLGYLGQVFRHAGSGLEALRNIARFAALFDSHAARYPLEIRMDERSVELRVARELTSVAPECVEAVCFAMITQLRNIGGSQVCVIGARFHNQREPLRDEYERFLGCPVRFGCDDDALVFDRQQLEAPIAGASSERSERIAAYVSRTFARAEDAEAAFAAAVECAVQAQLQSGELSEARAAGALGMSLRSFQRKLHESGKSYSRIVMDTRLANALRLLADPRLAIYEVAFSLGYQDVSSFNRAFRRWTGKSPRAHRGSSSPSAQ